MKKNLITRMSAFTLTATMALGGFSVQAAQPEIVRAERAALSSSFAISSSYADLTDAQKDELKALQDQSKAVQKEMLEKYKEYGIAETTFEKDGLTITVGTIQDSAKYEISDEERETILARRVKIAEGNEDFIAFRQLGDKAVENLQAKRTKASSLIRSFGMAALSSDAERPHTIAVRAVESADLGEGIEFSKFDLDGERPYAIAVRTIEGEDLGERIEFSKVNFDGERPNTIALRAIESADLGERIEFSKVNFNGEIPHTISIRAVEGADLGEKIEFSKVNFDGEHPRTIATRAFDTAVAGVTFQSDRFEMPADELQSIIEEMKAELQDKIATLTDEQKAELVELHRQLNEIGIAILEKELEFNLFPDGTIIDGRIEAIRNSLEDSDSDLNAFVTPHMVSVSYSAE